MKMTTLTICYKLNRDLTYKTFDVTSTLKSITADIFMPEKKAELNAEAPFLANLIWGCIGSYVNRKINKNSVRCTIKFDNGNPIELPQKIINANFYQTVESN